MKHKLICLILCLLLLPSLFLSVGAEQQYVIDNADLMSSSEEAALEEKAQAMPNQLSGGQQQRVAIARALAAKPAILLADEPTGNLDSKTGMDVIALLKMTSQAFHQTIVMITHNEEIALMADRMVRIEDGKVVNGDAAK